MKTKLELADAFVLKAFETGHSFELNEIVTRAWYYADLMHAEAEKREQNGLPDVLKDELPNGFSRGGYVEPRAHTLAGVVGDLNGSNSSQLEWQPDWSQAREEMRYFAVDMNGNAYFYSHNPNINPSREYWGFGGGAVMNKESEFCETHDYRGNWQDSLRKRP